MTQPERILARLVAIRERGYAFTEEQYLLGDYSVAAAVVERSGVAHDQVSKAPLIVRILPARLGHSNAYSRIAAAAAIS